jgi:hypothetical protein
MDSRAVREGPPARPTITGPTKLIMSKTKTPPNGASGPVATEDQPTYRTNPEVDAKIDSYIQENPKHWAFIQGMTRDRLERSLVLNEVQKLDRQQRVRESVMKRINANPEMKQAFDTLVKNVPEDQREQVTAQIAMQARRSIARSQSTT